MALTDAGTPKPTQTVERALSLLDVLGDGNSPLALTEIAQRAGLHISTCLRLLRTLEGAALVERVGGTGRYRLGAKIFTLAHALERQLDIRAVARPILQRVSDATGEGASLVVRQGTEAMVLERAINRSELGFLAGVGARGPLYCTASGKALLAYAEPEFVDLILGGPFALRTTHTITTPERLREEIARIRERGFAVDRCEREEGLFGVAAPVRDVTSRVVAAVSVTGPAERINTAALPTTLDLLIEAATEISAQLGWVDAGPNGGPLAASVGRRGADALGPTAKLAARGRSPR